MTSLYDSVVAITDSHLGPEADRFVVRQMRNHLHKDPHQLQPDDLRRMLDWIQLAMRLVSSDSAAIDRYVADLAALTPPSKTTASEKRVGH